MPETFGLPMTYLFVSLSLYILMFLSVHHYDCNANHYFKTLIVSYAIDLNVIVTI